MFATGYVETTEEQRADNHEERDDLPSSEELARHCRVVVHLSKPVDRDALLSCIARVLVKNSDGPGV